MQLEGSTIVWHPDGDRVATIAARRGLQEVVVVDISSGVVTRVDDGLQHAAALCAAGDGLVFVAARVERPGELHATTWSPGAERVLTRFNRDWAENRAAPRVDKRSFQVPDGNGGSEEIDAWVLLPAEGEGPFPLLVDFHGGPQSHVLIDFASHVYGYDLLSHGWAIVAANTVGSGSYGARFAERLNGHWGELDLPQHLAVVEALQAERIAGGAAGLHRKVLRRLSHRMGDRPRRPLRARRHQRTGDQHGIAQRHIRLGLLRRPVQHGWRSR